MPRFHIFFFLLFAPFVILPRLCFAASIPTYDIDSLCYMSTDVVVASLYLRPVPGPTGGNYETYAIVRDPIAGTYHSGDVIAPLYEDLHCPSPEGGRCILFIARQRFNVHLEPAESIAPDIVDILFIDTQNRVRRYFQQNDPGGLVAEGYMEPGIPWPTLPGRKSVPVQYPTFVQERRAIALKWAEVEKLRPLLSHDPRPQDVPVLLDLLGHRTTPRLRRMRDGLSIVICSRLADLDDPHIALDALSLASGSAAGWLSGLETEPFRDPVHLAYAQAIAQDVAQPPARRAAAAEVLRYNAVKL